jgi:hypothetical protein
MTKSTRLVGGSVNYAYAVKAGPWVFLNGHEAFDFERGLSPEVEGTPGNRLSGRPPLRREADYLLRRMRGILKEFGTDLPNAVRVDQFYTMGPAVSAYHLARFAEFGTYIPPSTSIIMERCFTARTNIHTSLIAVVPRPDFEVDKFTLPGPGDLGLGLQSRSGGERFRLRRRQHGVPAGRHPRPQGLRWAHAQLGWRNGVPKTSPLRHHRSTGAIAKGRRFGS